jgi:hypothetical protein
MVEVCEIKERGLFAYIGKGPHAEINSGAIYRVLHIAMLKIDDFWDFCVVYQDVRTQKVYVRPRHIFARKFAKAE